MPINYQSILSLLNAEQEHKIILSNNRMDYKIIRLNSNDADITTTDKKHFSFFLKKPIILNDEYVLQVKEFLVDSTYTTSARVITAPLIQDLYVRFNNSDWGNTSYGIYTFYSQDATNTLVFEVYDNAGTKQARLLSVTTNFNMNYFNGQFTIYFQPSPPFWAIAGGSLLHNELGSNFIWGKATDFITGATQTRVLVEPSMGRKYKVKIDNIQHKPYDYCNSNQEYTARIIFMHHNNIPIKKVKDANYLLTLPPQILSSIKISIESEDEALGLTGIGDNFSLCLFLSKKKYIVII